MILLVTRAHTIMVVFCSYSYVCCNLPAMIVTLLDPSGEQLPEVRPEMQKGNKHVTHPQAHVPTLILLWMSGVVNPVVYVVFNPLYRFGSYHLDVQHPPLQESFLQQSARDEALLSFQMRIGC